MKVGDTYEISRPCRHPTRWARNALPSAVGIASVFVVIPHGGLGTESSVLSYSADILVVIPHGGLGTGEYQAGVGEVKIKTVVIPHGGLGTQITKGLPPYQLPSCRHPTRWARNRVIKWELYIIHIFVSSSHTVGSEPADEEGEKIWRYVSSSHTVGSELGLAWQYVRP